MRKGAIVVFVVVAVIGAAIFALRRLNFPGTSSSTITQRDVRISDAVVFHNPTHDSSKFVAFIEAVTEKRGAAPLQECQEELLLINKSYKSSVRKEFGAGDTQSVISILVFAPRDMYRKGPYGLQNDCNRLVSGRAPRAKASMKNEPSGMNMISLTTVRLLRSSLKYGAVMKTLTCRDLGGPCDMAFTASSFEEIGRKSHEHVMDQMAKGDAAHLSAANEMRTATPDQQKAMMAEFKRKFDEAPDA